MRAGIKNALLTTEAQHLEDLRKEKASKRCSIGWEKLSAGQAWVSKAGKWSTCRYLSAQWSQLIERQGPNQWASAVVPIHCSQTLCGTGIVEIGEAFQVTHMREKYYLVADRRRKIRFIRVSQYLRRAFLTISADSDRVGHGTAPLSQQRCVSLPWHNGLCLPCTVWMLCKHVYM